MGLMKTGISVGVISDWIGSPYHIGIISGISDFARENNIEVFCFITGRINSPFDWEQKRNVLFNFPSPKRLDGLIILTTTISNVEDKKNVEDFIKSRYSDFPVLSIGMSIEGISSIEIDNRSGFKTLLEHIIREHKVKKIAFVSGPHTNPEAKTRYDTFMETVKENKNLIEETLVVQGDFSLLSGREVVKKIFDEKQFHPDAIVCANDQMAFGVMEELEYRKIEIPDDLILTGFDDVDLSYEKELTTVHQPIYEIGYKSLEILFNIINRKKTENSFLVLPTYPVFRSSCGCSGKNEIKNNRIKIHQEFHESYQEKLNDLGERLVTEFDIKKQLEIFENSVSFFGIDSFYICFYEKKFPLIQKSTLKWAFDSNKRLKVGKHNIFDTIEIIPRDYRPSQANTYIVQGLFQGDEQMGYLVLKFCLNEGMVYDILRQKLSIALRISNLIESLKLHSENLEKLVKEKTQNLENVNKRLIKEVEERKKIEEKLRESETRFKEIATFLPMIIIETDFRNKIEFINKAGMDLFDITTDKNNLFDFIYKEDIQKVTNYCREILTNEVSTFTEFRIISKEGKRLTLLSKAIPIVKNDKVEGLRWCCLNLNSVISSILLPEETFFKKYNFSKREKEVFKLLLEGNKVKEIARKLYISESTVKSHITSIYEEIGVKNKTEFFNKLREYQLKEFGYESFIFSVLSYLIKSEEE
jgi:LacI family transcriptional regulator